MGEGQGNVLRSHRAGIECVEKIAFIGRELVNENGSLVRVFGSMRLLIETIFPVLLAHSLWSCFANRECEMRTAHNSAATRAIARSLSRSRRSGRSSLHQFYLVVCSNECDMPTSAERALCSAIRS